MPLVPTESRLVDDAIAVLSRADRARAAELLARVITEDPTSEAAWLWLSEVVASVAERRFCLERVLVVNPEHPAANFGLSRLGAEVIAQAPSLPPDSLHPQQCTFPGCAEKVSRAGFQYCYGHWRAIYKVSAPPTRRDAIVPAAPPSSPDTVARAPRPQPGTPDNLLTASAVGERLGVKSRNLSLLFAELGWVNKAQHGWKATEAGRAAGAVQKYNTQTGVPFVVWPEQVILHPALRVALALELPARQATKPKSTSERSFRERFPAQHRTTDGHYVRSRAEMLIDNWLYMADIAHAYERQLPIEEEVYSDFYVPSGRVYIDYWGMERDQNYLARKQAKQALYHKYKLHLIELTDDHIKNLDDHLPRMLLKYGVDVS